MKKWFDYSNDKFSIKPFTSGVKKTTLYFILVIATVVPVCNKICFLDQHIINLE